MPSAYHLHKSPCPQLIPYLASLCAAREGRHVSPAVDRIRAVGRRRNGM